MPPDDERQALELRSYRVVFALERRLHRLDHVLLPVPYGIPLRAIGYFAAVLLGVLIAAQLPALGMLVGLLPAPLRLFALPSAAAFVLARTRVDGRHPERLLLSCLRLSVGWWARWRLVRESAFAVCEPVVIVPAADGSLRAGTISGPGTVVVTHPCRARQRGRTLLIAPIDPSGTARAGARPPAAARATLAGATAARSATTIRLARGQRVVVQPVQPARPVQPAPRHRGDVR